MTETKRKHTVAIISTGDEVVEGRTLDTNAAYIADCLAPLGFDVVSQVTVGDYVERIAWAWQRSFEVAEVVISTGGIGPTADDLTNQTLAEVAGVELRLDQEQAERIRELFERMGRHMPENNLRQARLPAGAEVIPNRLGTAPGYRLAVSSNGCSGLAIVLPGVPREMRAMLEEEVVPFLTARILDGTDGDQCVASRTFQTFGMSESAIDEAVSGLIDPREGRVAFRASFPRIAVRLTLRGQREDVERRLEVLGDRLAESLGKAVYGEGEVTMEEVVGALLTERGKTLVTAESCTGGLIGSRITDVAGSSKYYTGGLVAYSNDLKQKTLEVSKTTLSMFGAVSEETACEMALGARRLSGADIAVATTGIAGPDGGSDDKPVGTVAIALVSDGQDGEEVSSKIYRLWGDRRWVKTLASQVALDWVRRSLLGLEPLESNFARRRDAR